MSLSTTMIAGFGVDLENSYKNIFSSFFNSFFDNPIDSDDFSAQIIELWYMKKNGYVVPDGEYVHSYESEISPEWKAYHRLVTNESKYFNLSLNIYGHCYADDGNYLLVVNDTLVEKEKINKSDLSNDVSKEAMKDLEEFIEYFNLKKPDWHIVSLTC